jgi:fumarate reductase (CoM/CoB) subunit A
MELDYRSYLFVVSPEAHYWMGGVTINSEGRASLARLFAAGETAGGIQGANRLNSNALPETQVFGARAGIAAAAGLARPARPPLLAAPPGLRDGGFTEAELGARLRALRDRMWLSLGIIRQIAEMREGLGVASGATAGAVGARPGSGGSDPALAGTRLPVR